MTTHNRFDELPFEGYLNFDELEALSGEQEFNRYQRPVRRGRPAAMRARSGGQRPLRPRQWAAHSAICSCARCRPVFARSRFAFPIETLPWADGDSGQPANGAFSPPAGRDLADAPDGAADTADAAVDSADAGQEELLGNLWDTITQGASTPFPGQRRARATRGTRPDQNQAPQRLDQQNTAYTRWLQRSLNQALGLRLPVNGAMSPAVRSALRSFQRQHGLPEHGDLSDTRQALRAAVQSQSSTMATTRRRPTSYEMYDAGGEAETGVEVAALGVAVFQVVQQIASSGDLSVQADVARYVHQNTPAYVPFTKRSIEFQISAYHPRYGIDTQQFYFRLSFEYNRYDIRNLSITVLRDKSSSLYSSTFTIDFKASEYSLPSDPVASIAYNISNGRWDPVGLGDVSFWASPLLIVKADGTIEAKPIASEEDWVKFVGFTSGTLNDTPIPGPSMPGSGSTPTPKPTPASGARPTLRVGSRDGAVPDLQIRLNRWLVSQGRQPLTVDGVFGNGTKAAVISFQRAMGLTPDGVVGANTWAKLQSW